jgi:transcription antitermination protein NusB
MANRRVAREHVLKALYAMELSGDSAEHIINSVLNPGIENDAQTKEFANRLFLRTLNHVNDLDTEIQKLTANWDLKRMAVIDRMVLRIAVCEFLYFEDIPAKVTINEAIEIVKKYSTEKSGRFVNGILDAILENFKNDDRFKKTGRGLLDSTTGNKK